MTHGTINAVRSRKFLWIKAFSLVVPEDYTHATRLDAFKTLHEKKFFYYNDALTDKNFGGVSTVLTPGERYTVNVFNVLRDATSTECLARLRRDGGVLVGAQGLTLVYEAARDELPPDCWNISFDKKSALWRDTLEGLHRMPYIRTSHEGFGISLGYFKCKTTEGRCLLSFVPS